MPEFVHPIDDILKTMDVYGGSFVQQLAKLYRYADSDNSKILLRSFSHYFLQYDELTTIAKRRAGTEGTPV